MPDPTTTPDLPLVRSGLRIIGTAHPEYTPITDAAVAALDATAEQQPRGCDECDETTGVHTYGTVHLCPSCHHDAVRSGWTPEEEA